MEYILYSYRLFENLEKQEQNNLGYIYIYVSSRLNEHLDMKKFDQTK